MPTLTDLDLIQNAVLRAEALKIAYPKSFASFQDAERYVKDSCEERWFRYGLEAATAKSVRMDVEGKVHRRVVNRAYDAEQFTIDANPKADAWSTSGLAFPPFPPDGFGMLTVF